MKLLTQAKMAPRKPLVIGLLTAIGAIYTVEDYPCTHPNLNRLQGGLL
jgi:hypothetical protein